MVAVGLAGSYIFSRSRACSMVGLVGKADLDGLVLPLAGLREVAALGVGGGQAAHGPGGLPLGQRAGRRRCATAACRRAGSLSGQVASSQAKLLSASTYLGSSWTAAV